MPRHSSNGKRADKPKEESLPFDPPKTKKRGPRWYRERETANLLYRFTKSLMNTNGSSCKYGYFTYFRGFNFITENKMDSLFLQDLINLGASAENKDGEWFLCTGCRLESVGWTTNEQKYRFKALSNLNFINSELRGLPARRWVQINMGAILEALDRKKVLPEADDGWFLEFVQGHPRW